MKYEHKDKSQFNVRLSHFLYNGLDVISAQLGINRSEVMRMALYNLLKDTYTKKEMDWFASRDDVVDEWIEFLKTPGRTQDFTKMKMSHEATVNEVDKYIDAFDDELDKKLKPIKKKYAVSFAEDFLKNTGMNEKEASEYFKNYFKTAQKQSKEYMEEINKYFKTNYSKDVKEIEVKLEKLTGMKKGDVLAKQISINLDNMQEYLQELIEQKNTPSHMVDWAKDEISRIEALKNKDKKNFGDKKETLRKYKEKYLKKYADDPGIVELIKQVNDPEVFNKIRGERNPQAVYQILMPAYDIGPKDYDKFVGENKEENKKDHDKKKKK